MCDEVTMVLEELANRFEMGGEAIWTSQQVADAPASATRPIVTCR